MKERDPAQRRTWLLRGLIFFQGWLVAQSRVAAYAWLLQSGHGARLPWAYVGQAALVVLATLGLFGLVDRLGRARVLLGLYLAFALGVAMASQAPPSVDEVVSPLFLLFIEGAATLLGTHYWLLAGELLSPTQSRQRFPSFTLFAGVGAIAGGAMGHVVPGAMLRLTLAGPTLACALLTLAADRRYGYRVGARADAAQAPFTEDLGQGLALLKGTRLVRGIGLFTALVTVLGVAIDYLFTVSIADDFQGDGVPRALANLSVVVSGLQLLLVATLGSRLFTSFGLFRTFESYPLGGLAASALGLPLGLTPAAALLKVWDRLESYLVMSPGVGLALAAFPRELRGRVSFVFGGLLKPVALGTAGLCLVLATPPRVALAVAIAVSMAALVPLLRRLAGVYRETLVGNLRSADVRLVAGSLEALAEPHNSDVVPQLLSLAAQTADPVLTENVLKAAGTIGDERFLPLLLASLKSENSSLKIAAAGALQRFDRPEVQTALLEALTSETSARVKASLIAALGSGREVLYPVLRAGLVDPEARVRANAVEAIGLSGDPLLISELRPLLDSVSAREIANVIVALSRVGQHRPAARDALLRIFEGADRALLASALWAAGELGDDSLAPTVRRYVGDDDAMVRRNAVIALGKLEEPGVVQAMVRLLLGPPDDAMAMARAVSRLPGGRREELLAHLSRMPRPERAQVSRAFSSCGLNYADELYQLR